jgi:hypothetical protein
MLLILAVEQGLWTKVTIWVVGAMTCFLSLILVVFSVNPKEHQQEIARSLSEGNTGSYFLFGIPYMHYWGLVLLYRGIWNTWGATAFPNAPAAPSILDWMAFGLDRFLGIVLVDAPNTFGFRISSIEPAKIFWLSLFVFLYQVSLTIGFVAVLVRSYRIIVLSKRR